MGRSRIAAKLQTNERQVTVPPVRRRSGRSAPPLHIVQNSGPPIRSVREGRSKKLSLCVYGEPGIGKTVFIGTCNDLPGKNGGKAKVLLIRPPVDHTDSIVNNDVDELVINNWAEADDALLYARNDGAGIYDWVWLDSLSLWQDQGLDDIWEQTVERKPARAAFGLDKGEYGINMMRIGKWVRHMVGCPEWHFGLTCHPRQGKTSEDEEDTDERLMPWVQGKNMPQKICGYMNIVGFYHWDTVGRGGNTKARVLSIGSADKYYAKDQFTCTPDGRVVNPTMPKLMELIMASGNFKTDGAKATGTNRRTNTRRRKAAVGRK